ncbi:uncharacterized protein J8A68_003450 [[Candida] subhashii]|uniref:Serine aminopeptidase S33 domain-containing protein n=1 Tax=[Candida] subhashii TaxID=561895 RepID=A0A8J5QMD1_9ASCO|nr:uncharacterized protein J8A68_003450 [[Candida] subhashii]KAG7663023.1 hypothetical protein J8A68_003450 [[Candida] subhashii]
MTSGEIPYKPKGTPVIEFVEYNGAKFKTVSWLVPEGIDYKGKIICVHGFAEHSEIYYQICDHLSQNGYELFFFDQRGAGDTSPGNLIGKTDEYHTFNDLDYFIKRNLDARKDADSTEQFFLMGHSMGGAIVLNYGIRGKYKDHIKGIISSAPLIELHPETQVNIVVRVLTPVINKLVPNLKIDSKLKWDYITSDPEWKKYLMSSDKLIGTVRQFHDMFARGEALLKKEYASKFSDKIALLIVHSPIDKINDYQGSAKVFDNIPEVVDKKLQPIEDAQHSLFIEREELFNKTLDICLEFLNSHS